MKGAKLLRIVEQYDRAVDKQEAATIKRINKRLLEALQSIDTQLADYYSGLSARGSLAAQMQVRRSEELAALLGQIEPEYDSFYQSEFDSLLRTSNVAGTELADELLTSYGTQSAVSSFTTIPYAAIANQASEGVKRLSNHTATFRSQASAVIEQGLIQGKGAKWMQRQLKQQITGITAKKAEDIARTESSSALNAAAEQRYANAGMKYVQWLITPSQRVCPFCAGRNGQVYELGKARIPAHVRCRCMLIGWSKEWQKAGLTDDAFIIGYHNKGVAELRKNGMQPKYTEQAPFERSDKLPAPKVIWTPRGKDSAAATFKQRQSTAIGASVRSATKIEEAFGTATHEFPALEAVRQSKAAPAEQLRKIAELYSQTTGISFRESRGRISAIGDYTGDDYIAIRAAQRGRDVFRIRGEGKLYNAMRKKAEDIEAYIASAVKFKQPIMRGINLESAEDFFRRYGSEGDEFLETSMNSWTSNTQTAVFFSDGSPQSHGFIFRVENQTRGTSVKFFSKEPSENEIIVPSNTKYRIKSINKMLGPIDEPTRYTVLLEELLND